MVQVDELKGYQSYKAFCAYNHLLMGMKMLPEYMNMNHEKFFEALDTMPSEDKRIILKKAAMFVQLEEDELQAMIFFCRDKHGVRYGKENMKNLNPAEIAEIIVAVSMQIAEFKIDFTTDEEKKK